MKKVYVKKDDYDLYSIKLPLKLFFRRKRKNYIARELEKIHPNFSLANAEDTKISFKKNGLFASVAVMEREKISEYKSGFPNSKLFLESKPNRSVFNFQKEHKKTLILCLIAILGFCSIKICNYFLSKSATSNVKNQTTISSNIELAASAALLAPQELFAAVLASVKEKSGRVTNLSWNNGKCSFAITGCNSEDVAGASYCVVSYSSGKPQFNFVSKVNDRKMAAKATIPANEISKGIMKTSFRKVENVIPYLRSVLLSCGADILSEKVNKDDSSITFVCVPEKLSKILKEISEAARKSGWSENSIFVDCDNHFVSVNVSFKNLCGEILPFDNPLLVLSNYADVFAPEKIKESIKHEKIKISPQKINKNTTFENSSSQNYEKVVADSSKIRIGEIKKNNESYVFYKGRDGKIFREAKNAN